MSARSSSYTGTCRKRTSQLRAAERAVELARGLKDREQSDLANGKGTIADVAEANQRLEQFNLDLVTRTSDVVTTEQQLRQLLGLPGNDDRRIVPVTPPAEAKLEPDWEECLAVMLKKLPAIVQMKALVKEAESNKDGDGLARLERREAYLKQVIHDSTHSLARLFLEIDANYKQFETAPRLRAAAARRLESQRAFYEEGRITIDRFLDAMTQYAVATATEAQYKTAYNNTIVALEEAKGTLLDHDQITVVEAPKSAVSIAAVPDFSVRDEWYEPPVLPEPQPRKRTSADFLGCNPAQFAHDRD